MISRECDAAGVRNIWEIAGEHIAAERMDALEMAGIHIGVLHRGENFFLENIEEFKGGTSVEVADEVKKECAVGTTELNFEIPRHKLV